MALKYRNIYTEINGKIDFDKEIHHIDGNRKNNKIKNLVSIPIELHKKYHQNEKEMMFCFRKNNKIGFEYHRDLMIECYYKMMVFYYENNNQFSHKI